MVVNYNSLCKCGHTVEDHHNPLICKTNNFPIDTTKYCAENRKDFPHAHGEECEYYGFNEMGGLIKIENEWVAHCFKLALQ